MDAPAADALVIEGYVKKAFRKMLTVMQTWLIARLAWLDSQWL